MHVKGDDDLNYLMFVCFSILFLNNFLEQASKVLISNFKISFFFNFNQSTLGLDKSLCLAIHLL